MKVALVYDRINKWGGAERVLLALCEIWPEAPIFTAVYNPPTAPWVKSFRVFPSFLNKFPLAKTNHEFYPWLMPLVFESFNFEDYDVVVSLTSEAAKGIITKPSTLHICYCLTPTRYLWNAYDEYFKNKFLRIISRPVVNYLKRWDKIASGRPDYFIAISKNVQKRIKKYYQKEAEVIYPPIETERFQINSKTQNKSSNFFLIVSRLVSYKKIDLAVRAFNQLGLPLKIIGTGKEMKRLKKIAKKNIKFLGQLTDENLLSYYQKCRALVFPQEEDFGLVPLEAQACGKPVIAFRGGGALETVISEKTGIFFWPQTVEALKKAVERFLVLKFDPEECRKNAMRFAKEEFKRKFENFVKEKLKDVRRNK